MTARGRIIPLGWTGDAFCSNLDAAIRGSDPAFSKASSEHNSRFNRAQQNEITKVIYAYRRGKVKQALQSKIFQCLHSCKQDDWPKLLERRANMFLSITQGSTRQEQTLPQNIPTGPWVFTDEFRQQWHQVAKVISKQVIFIVLKTWANAWCTTHRYHENTLWPCIFGCEGDEDELSHYLCCHRFWSGMIEACFLQDFVVHADPLVQCCLRSPSPPRAKMIAVASNCYHTLKLQHREVVQAAVGSGNFAPCMEILRDAARHFASEYRVT